uniref:Protein-PII uridylyltransferase N-terminal domain-containing protein n=1 Tax=Branchiostoma floridae TaxID=7739 RepID=C3YI30_BRAFL|eukprot:XP_002604156.1 hypothetical protein BRAFLDRAFT_71552 [Branchiostoma floridae]
MTSLADKLQDLELCLKSQHEQEVSYGRALREAIVRMDLLIEVEVLKSLGDLRLQKGKLGKDSAEFDKAAALYAVALLQCKDPDTGQTLEHRIGYMEKLSRQLLQGYTPHFRWLLPDYWGTADSNVLRVAETCEKLDRSTKYSQHSVEETYTETLVTAIETSDMFLEVEVLKSLGDFYLEKGKETGVSQFTKAAAMYKKALTRCEDPETKQTLKHRIRYAEKIRERAKMVKNTYEDYLQKGNKDLQTGDLDKAEEHFAAALKSVHVKGEHREEAEPLYRLSEVYMKRGIQSKDGGDFTKAAALCNAALVRSKREDIEEAIQDITQSFVKHVLNTEQMVEIDNTKKQKLMLKKDRDYAEGEIKMIDENIDPYSLDDDDPELSEMEKKRVEAIKTLFQSIVDQRKTFIARLVDECIEVMGPPPCKYAMIGLGSQATGLVTPYSDLEFAILIDEETEHNAKYFRNLTHYLHLKVINLGETILPAMGIKTLNDFYSDNPLDSWYYDSVTPRGFSFDGAMPHACKTPLGRGRTSNSTGSSELIHTPCNMTNVLKDDLKLHLKKGYHLGSILGNVSLVAGEQGLVDEYMSLCTKQRRENDGKVLLAMAKTDLTENAPMFQIQDLTASLLNVKKEMYRFSSLVVSIWALLHNIQMTTIWDTIQELRNRGFVNDENAHHLMVMVSISAELRLRTYMNNHGQVENMSALSSMTTDTDMGEKLKKVFYFSNRKQLMRYYYTARPLKHFISHLSEKKPKEGSPTFFDNSSELKAEVYESLCDYKSSRRCQEAIYRTNLSKYGEDTAHFDIAQSLANLGNSWMKLADYSKAVGYHEQSLQMFRDIHGENTVHYHIASSLDSLGRAWGDLGDYKKAVSYHKESLQMMRSIYSVNTANQDMANSLNNMGTAWINLGDYKNALSCFEQSLQTERRIYGENISHPGIASILNNLGIAWKGLGVQKKAISYYEESLRMKRSIYGENTAYPDILTSLHNLGAAWSSLDDHRKAINYYEQSLQMARIIYGEENAHPCIATSLNSLGIAWCHLSHYRNAISYHEQSLQMLRSIYGEDTAHPDIAESLNNLGANWGYLGDQRKAVSYYEQSLQMMRIIYGEDTARSDIAFLLNNLGNAWSNLGDSRKAMSYYEQSLQMRRSIHGDDTAHPDIADSLNSLGIAWGRLGDHRKAVNYYEQSLKMKQTIYGEDTAHPDIASTLNNLGSALRYLGDYRKAMNNFEKSLQMGRIIHGEDTAHSYIADLLGNLGVVWSDLGDHRKAINYYEQSLKMRQSIYGEDTVHPDIADSLSNIGSTWSDLAEPSFIMAEIFHTSVFSSLDVRVKQIAPWTGK